MCRRGCRDSPPDPIRQVEKTVESCVESTVRKVGLPLNISNESVENLLSEASSFV